MFEFWAFQKNMPMSSREKFIFHMLFRAFHNNSRIWLLPLFSAQWCNPRIPTMIPYQSWFENRYLLSADFDLFWPLMTHFRWPWDTLKTFKDLYNKYHSARLSTEDNLNGNIYIHPTAKVDPSAKIGPHVAIGANVVVYEGSYWSSGLHGPNRLVR